MVKIVFKTLAGESFNKLNKLLDFNNPLEDPRLDTMKELLLLRQGECIVKLVFVIGITTFNTLYDAIMHANLVDELVTINVVFIKKPTPPSYPSIGLDIIRTTHCDDLCGLPEEPSCFLEWYGYEDNIKRLLDKDSNYFPYRDETRKYRFTCFGSPFDNIEEAITYAIIKSVDEQNITPDSKFFLDAYIKPGSSIFQLFEIRLLEQEIYSYLLTLPEWNEYFNLWDAFWIMSSREQRLAKLNSNQNMHVI